MYYLCLPLVGLFAGFAVGYRETKKEDIPSYKFVETNKKKDVLKQYHLNINEFTICDVCSESISIDNLGMVIPTADRNIFVCSKPKCMVTKNTNPSSSPNIK
jgi:hypothetical protein